MNEFFEKFTKAFAVTGGIGMNVMTVGDVI